MGSVPLGTEQGQAGVCSGGHGPAELLEENVICSLPAPHPLPNAPGRGRSPEYTALLAEPAAGPMKWLFQLRI